MTIFSIIFLPGLDFHKTTGEKIISIELELNPVSMIIINPWKAPIFFHYFPLNLQLQHLKHVFLFTTFHLFSQNHIGQGIKHRNKRTMMVLYRSPEYQAAQV